MNDVFGYIFNGKQFKDFILKPHISNSTQIVLNQKVMSEYILDTLAKRNTTTTANTQTTPTTLTSTEFYQDIITAHTIEEEYEELINQYSSMTKIYVLSHSQILTLLNNKNTDIDTFRNLLSETLGKINEVLTTPVPQGETEEAKKIRLVKKVKLLRLCQNYFIKKENHANIDEFNKTVTSWLTYQSNLERRESQQQQAQQDGQGAGTPAKKKRKAKIIKTDQKVLYKKKNRVVYEGPRGGKYIKVNDKLISLSNINS
jgi:hypothetical protein